MQKTRYPELLLDHVAGAGWRFADAQTRGHVGAYYASKGEALADLDRYYRDSWAGAEARPAGGYSLTDRTICGPSGLKLATLSRVQIPEDEHPDRVRGAYTILPTELDRFARQIVEALNADPRRPDLRPAPRFEIVSGMGPDGREFAILDNLTQEHTSERFSTRENAERAAATYEGGADPYAAPAADLDEIARLRAVARAALYVWRSQHSKGKQARDAMSALGLVLEHLNGGPLSMGGRLDARHGFQTVARESGFETVRAFYPADVAGADAAYDAAEREAERLRAPDVAAFVREVNAPGEEG